MHALLHLVHGFFKIFLLQKEISNQLLCRLSICVWLRYCSGSSKFSWWAWM